VPSAPSILLRNWYGWFTRIGRGLYRLTPEGALARWVTYVAHPKANVRLREMKNCLAYSA
jgi:hypothetical protein